MTTDAARKPATIPVIRPATADDLAACAEIINDWIDETDWHPRLKPREEIAALFNPDLLERRAIWLAELGGQVVGYVSVKTDEAFVVALFVRPAARGLGIGAMLLDRARQMYPGGLNLSVYELNTGAQRFYLREGFAEVPEGRNDDTEEGVPTLLMRWDGTGRVDEG